MRKKNDLKIFYTEKQLEACTVYYKISLTRVQNQEFQQCSM